MVKKELFALGMFILLTGSVLSFVNFCCEKTNSGAWCQNDLEQECNTAYQKTPTSCESTSYCKMGCCYDIKEGTCSRNTPERVCRESGGIWSDNADCAIGECQLGCCLIGDQAAFVTGTRCKRLANLYGLPIDFRMDLQNEMECIASINSEKKGACLYQENYLNECTFTTQRECNNMPRETKFYKGKLCSASELNTVCAPTKKTTCVEGKDQVFFVDSCGNVANVYDSTKIDSQEYWSNVYEISESCGYGSSNVGNSACGNCDYYYGSTCNEYKRNEDRAVPVYGDYICKDLSCEYNNKKYEHGESWCETNGKADVPGSKYFRLLCYNKEVIVEPCTEFRHQTCHQDSIDGFSVAACVQNEWQDCTLQDNEKDCLNSDRRDCTWLEDVVMFNGGESGSKKVKGVCVPLHAPGFDFWNSEGDASQFCGSADTICRVEYEKGLIGSKKCVKNCECLTEEWENSMIEMCVSLGDCGADTNYIGRFGYNDPEDYFSKKKGKK